MRNLPLAAAAVAAAVGTVLSAFAAAPAQAEHAWCLSARTTIDGTGGPDRIAGTQFADVIASFGGADEIHARGGGDRVCAGPGSDVVFDGFGADTIDGGDGFDTVYACPDGARDVLLNVERVVSSSVGCH
jgi:Ca2+-binding RTX toxin-like protein